MIQLEHRRCAVSRSSRRCRNADETPRLFPVVQEYGDREGARIAAWGMAFANHVEVAAVDGTLRLNLRTPTNALRAFGGGGQVRTRLVWLAGKWIYAEFPATTTPLRRCGRRRLDRPAERRLAMILAPYRAVSR